MSIKHEIILSVHCGMVFPYRSQDVTWGEFCPPVMNLGLNRLRGHLCVQESSIKGKEPEEKENPKTQIYLLRQIQSRKGNIWLARRRTVGGVGAVHGWSRGGNSRPFVSGQNGALRGVTAGGPTSQTQEHTHTHSPSLTHMHACPHTYMFACTCMHTHTKKP